MIKPAYFYLVILFHLLGFAAVLIGIFVRSNLSNVLFIVGMTVIVAASVVSYFLRRRAKQNGQL